jgi:tetratricopeptide (TPR) repeat protein
MQGLARIVASLLACTALLLPSLAGASAKGHPAVQISTEKTDRSLVVTVESATQTSFTHFRLTNPSRIVVDLHGSETVERSISMAINHAGVERMRTGVPRDGTVRVALDLAEEYIPYSVERRGSKVVIIAGTKEPARPPQADAESSMKELEDEALRAEMRKDWDRAIALYSLMLDRDPKRVDLWLRIADIEGARGKPEKAAEALSRATAITPDDDALYFKLSQALSVANKPEEALAAIEKAVGLKPESREYLKARAELASWSKRLDVADESWQKVLELNPDDEEALLGLARVKLWRGETDGSVRYFKRYLKKKPDDGAATIEYARAEYFRGNYTKSLKVLKGYREKFGEDDAYERERARVLASAGRPREALRIVDVQDEKYPEDYDLRVIKTIALSEARRHREALDNLKMVEELEPENPQTSDVRRFVTLPVRSRITPSFGLYIDTDDLLIFTETLDVYVSPKPGTFLFGGIRTDQLTAEEGSGLEAKDGEETVEHYQGWIGASHVFTPEVRVAGGVGGATAESETIPTYFLNLALQPRDELTVSLLSNYGFYVISPRSVDEGVKRLQSGVLLHWKPVIGYDVDASFGYDFFSDENRKWEVTLAPRREVLRTQYLNLDLGVRAWWFGFRRDLDNGYYDPEFYQRYVATAFSYVKFSDEIGLSLMGEAGVQKDEEEKTFDFSGSASAAAIFGIFGDWSLRLRGSVFNTRLESGAFTAFSTQIEIERRF